MSYPDLDRRLALIQDQCNGLADLAERLVQQRNEACRERDEAEAALAQERERAGCLQRALGDLLVHIKNGSYLDPYKRNAYEALAAVSAAQPASEQP